MSEREWQETSEELAERVAAEVERLKDESVDIDAWAERLAADLVTAGEAEYGPDYANRIVTHEAAPERDG